MMHKQFHPRSLLTGPLINALLQQGQREALAARWSPALRNGGGRQAHTCQRRRPPPGARRPRCAG